MTQKQSNYYFIRGYMEKKAQLVEKNTLDLKKVAYIPFEEVYGKPLPKKRKLTKEELERIAYSKWVTKYPWRKRPKDKIDNSLTGEIKSTRTPIKNLTLAAVLGSLGALGGLAASTGPAHPKGILAKLKGAGVGALLTLPLSIPASFIGSSIEASGIRRNNRYLENLIRRLPPGSTREDFEKMYPEDWESLGEMYSD